MYRFGFSVVTRFDKVKSLNWNLRVQRYTKKLNRKNIFTLFSILLHVFINYLFKFVVISEFGGKITLNREKPFVIFRQKFVFFRQNGYIISWNKPKTPISSQAHKLCHSRYVDTIFLIVTCYLLPRVIFGFRSASLATPIFFPF